MQKISGHRNHWREVEEDRRAQHDVDMARAIGDKLTEHYPGHPWFVEVDSIGGLVHISIPVLMHNWRFNLKLRELASDPGLKLVVKAGGEILERWQVPRSRIDVAAFSAAMRHRLHGHKERPPA